MADLSIQVIEPTDTRYNRLVQVAATGSRSASKEQYNSLCTRYNAAAINSVIMAELQSVKLSNLEKVLSNRGLVRNQDYTMARGKTDAEGNPLPAASRPVLFQKLTGAVARIV